MPTHTNLKGFSEYGQAGLSEVLEQNLIQWLQWGFCNLGAWATVTRAASGVYGGDASRLRLSADPRYDRGQVWEGFRRDWVWESGIERAEQPIRVSGVWVDGTFHSVAATGAYAHYVDYPNGRVVFSSPISPSSVVQASYSYRYVHFTSADDPWWREVQTNSLRVDDREFLMEGSGAWAILPENRLQLPAVVVEAVPELSHRGLALGGGTIRTQAVNLYVLAETSTDRKLVFDKLAVQSEKRIHAFDPDRVLAATGYPLDVNGSPIPSAKMYPLMVLPFTEGGYGYREVRIMEVRGAALPAEYYGGLSAAVVRFSCEMDVA